MKYLIIVMLFTTLNPAIGQRTEIKFNVEFKGKPIGSVIAVREQTGNKIRKDVKSVTDAKVMSLSIHVESELEASYENDVLLKGIAYRHANRGAEDIHAEVSRAANTYQVKRNNVTTVLNNPAITFCGVDLYFTEPKNIKNIFSNMYGQFLTMREMSPGKYKVISPDQNASTYFYQNGKLKKIEVDMALGKLMITRV